MVKLVARNALAEDEAEHLSQMNAEILGHRNPTQRIFYVDKIRKELAETKQVGEFSVKVYPTVFPIHDCFPEIVDEQSQARGGA